VSRSRSLLRSVALPEHAEEAVEDDSEDEAQFSPISELSARRNWDVPASQSFRSPPLLERAYEPWGRASLLASEQHRRRRRFSDTSSPAHSRIRSRRPWDQDQDRDGREEGDSDSESDPDDPDDLEAASLIPNPERATPKERRWLRGMVLGRNPAVTKRFEECVSPSLLA
jgi:hypothetical protein